MRTTRFRMFVASLAAALSVAGLTAAAGGASTPGRQGSGDTIVIAALGPFTDPSTGTATPEWPAAVRARVKAINKAGGIGDTKLEVFECNTQLDPNLTEQCVRDAAEAGAVATLGWNGITGAAYFGALEATGIPAIGSVPVGLDEVTNPLSFPFTSGVPGAFEGLPIELGKEGATKQSLVITDLGAAAAAAEIFVKDSVARQGYTLGEAIKVPPDQTDFAPIAASATQDDPEGINVFIIGDAAGTFIQAVKQSGFEGALSSGSPFLTESVIEALGDNAEGIQVVSLLSWQKGKNAKLFAKDMKKYAKGQPLTDITANYWLSVWVFEQVAKGIVDGGGTVDAASVLAAMNDLTDFSTGGMTPPISTTVPFAQPPELPFQLPRMFNPTVTRFVIKDGKLKQVSKEFVDPFEKQ